jgi:hypothetical protein
MDVCVGRNSVLGIPTRYTLDGPEVESLWRRDFPHLSRPSSGLNQPLYNGYRVFPRVRFSGRGVVHLTSTSVELKEYSYTSPILGLRGLFYNKIYLFAYYGSIYSKAHPTHFTEFSTVFEHNNFITSTVFPLHQLLLTIHSFSDSNYVTGYNYRVSFMGVTSLKFP